MYRLKPEEDLSFLIGAVVLQVCIGQNEVILHLNDDIAITVMSDFSVVRDDNAVRYLSPIVAASSLAGLLGKSVDGARATEAGGMVVSFEDGQSLELFDTSDQFESFTLRIGDRLIVV